MPTSERGRRTGTLADFTELVKLAQALNIVHFMAGSAPGRTFGADPPYGDGPHPPAIPTRSRSVDHAGPHRGRLELVRMARGVSREQRCANQLLLRHQHEFADAARRRHGLGRHRLCQRNQAPCITPFTLLGAMAPVTIAGPSPSRMPGAGRHHPLADRAAGGADLWRLHLQRRHAQRRPAFGTPIHQACLIGGQTARRYNMPYRSSNTNASVWPDAQATYEGAMSIWGALMGGTNMLLHGVGWLEGGLVASYEKYIIDAEMLQTMAEFFTPTVVDDSTLAIDAIREAGHGGHFFGVQHTIERYETAFYTPLLSDWRNFQQWEATGSVDATHRATKIWKQLLADYEEPKLDPAIAEEMDAYIERRTREGGAPYV
jgi:trimethylamine--corrinoid protein Co-methyltransferase